MLEPVHLNKCKYGVFAQLTRLLGCSLPNGQCDILSTSAMLTRDPGKLRNLAVKRKASSSLQGLVVLEVGFSNFWVGGSE